MLNNTDITLFKNIYYLILYSINIYKNGFNNQFE